MKESSWPTSSRWLLSLENDEENWAKKMSKEEDREKRERKELLVDRVLQDGGGR